MERILKKRHDLQRRHRRLRQKVAGTAECPRMAVFRSLRNIYVQFIDDSVGKTLLSVSTKEEGFAENNYGGNIKAAAEIGKLAAQKAKTIGIAQVVFDRGGSQYHGRIKALADAAREGGLKF